MRLVINADHSQHPGERESERERDFIRRHSAPKLESGDQEGREEEEEEEEEEE